MSKKDALTKPYEFVKDALSYLGDRRLDWWLSEMGKLGKNAVGALAQEMVKRDSKPEVIKMPDAQVLLHFDKSPSGLYKPKTFSTMGQLNPQVVEMENGYRFFAYPRLRYGQSTVGIDTADSGALEDDGYCVARALFNAGGGSCSYDDISNDLYEYQIEHDFENLLYGEGAGTDEIRHVIEKRMPHLVEQAWPSTSLRQNFQSLYDLNQHGNAAYFDFHESSQHPGHAMAMYKGMQMGYSPVHDRFKAKDVEALDLLFSSHRP